MRIEKTNNWVGVPFKNIMFGGVFRRNGGYSDDKAYLMKIHSNGAAVTLAHGEVVQIPADETVLRVNGYFKIEFETEQRGRDDEDGFGKEEEM